MPEERMKTHLAAAGTIAALAALSGAVLTVSAGAHHSFAMYDHDHPVELTGTVKEFRFTNPHSVIVLDVKDKDGSAETWKLEGGSASALAGAGWTAGSLMPGDAVRVIVEPLRTGAQGGAWDLRRVWFLDGQPVVPLE
jgi:hypothetical protein